MSSNVLLLGCEKSSPPPDETSRGELPAILVRDPQPTAATALPRGFDGGGPAPTLPCLAGYQLLGPPDLDVLRAGALCGPPHGLLARQPARRAAPGEHELVERTHLDEDECVWVVAATTPTRAVELQWVAGGRLMTSCELDGFGWCPSQGPLCVESATSLDLSWDDTMDATLVLQIWRREGEGQSQEPVP